MDAVFDKEDDIKAELLVFEKFASHPNVVDFYGSYLKKQESADDQLWIVMEVGLVRRGCAGSTHVETSRASVDHSCISGRSRARTTCVG